LEHRKLGRTDLTVSRMCFGSLPMGKGQAKLDPETGANLIRESIKQGINFIDTAMIYGSYDYIREGKRGLPEKVIIATKCASPDEKETDLAVERSLKELDVKAIDIFHIHGSREQDLFNAYNGSLKCLLKHKKEGNIRYIGVATHVVSVVEEATERDDIDVIHPLINVSGLGILEGKNSKTGNTNTEAMLAAIRKARQKGKGIYAMKPLGGGHLINDYKNSMNFLMDNAAIDSIAVGMVSTFELMINLRYFKDRVFLGETEVIRRMNKKFYVLKAVCKGCGACVKACPNGAIKIIDKISTIEHEKCILCGYCGLACPHFCIRIA
jgi:predicted aldo/keto reductase-like oxidoreductase